MTTSTIADLPVDALYVDPVNPRRHVEPCDVEELARSITARGIDQPLHVRPGPDGTYGVLSGQQRLAAAGLAGLDVVPCIVLEDLDDAAAAVVAVTGNSGRKMRPSDEARAYRQLVDGGMLQREVADACGVSEPRVSNLLRLLTLDDDLVAQVDAGKMGVGRAIAATRARYEKGRGKPRGTSHQRARELGALGAVHLTGKAAMRLLGYESRGMIGSLVRSGRLVRDEVTGGYPLHEVADLLDEQRREAVEGRVPPHVAARYVLPERLYARLERLAESTGHPAPALIAGAVEALLRRSHA